MHFLRFFLASVQKLCLLSFHFANIDKKGVGIKAGGVGNFSKIIGRGDDYSVLESACQTKFEDLTNTKMLASFSNGSTFLGYPVSME